MLLKKAGSNYTLYTTWYRTALMLATLDSSDFTFKFHINILQHTDYYKQRMITLRMNKKVAILNECLVEVKSRVDILVSILAIAPLTSLKIGALDTLIGRVSRALAIVYNVTVQVKDNPPEIHTVRDLKLLEGI